jgi:Fe-S-cluster containining protein
MTDTFYLHVESKGKNGWSINLPFLCTKCGNCCKLEDFLSAGKINAAPQDHPEAHSRVKTLFETLGDLWKAGETKYDAYIMNNPCPFLVNKSCSIYEIRPDGCRLFPKTAFGMQSQDCEPLIRFRKMLAVLKRGRSCTETYCFAGGPVKLLKSSEKQCHAVVAKLRQAGMTDDELSLFNQLNQFAKLP